MMTANTPRLDPKNDTPVMIWVQRGVAAPNVVLAAATYEQFALCSSRIEAQDESEVHENESEPRQNELRACGTWGAR